jgi:hypothetical protein
MDATVVGREVSGVDVAFRPAPVGLRALGVLQS